MSSLFVRKHLSRIKLSGPNTTSVMANMYRSLTLSPMSKMISLIFYRGKKKRNSVSLLVYNVELVVYDACWDKDRGETQQAHRSDIVDECSH